MVISKEFPPKIYALCFVTVATLLFTTVTYLTLRSDLEKILFLILTVAILLVASPVWLPHRSGQTRVRLASLAFMTAVVTAILAPTPWPQQVLAAILSILEIPLPASSQPPTPLIQAFVLVASLAAVFAINFKLSPVTAMTQHPTPLEREFPEASYVEDRARFCTMLKHDIERTDNETKWSYASFVPLDAEVDISTDTMKTRSVQDLLTAIKVNSKARLFLILGDPGGGKSVALRKLARDLLDEVQVANRIPIYINLREWDTQGISPSEINVSLFNSFVVSNLKKRSDVHGMQFIDKYYEKMHLHGRFFFLIDSFDEIPLIMDQPEGSDVVRKLSTVIATFLTGANESRGLIASRKFRQPQIAHSNLVRLDVRPFTEIKIFQAVRKHLIMADNSAIKIFRERPDLIPQAKNPFTLSLICDYIRNNGVKIPENQERIYQEYIGSCLGACDFKLNELGVTAEKVMETASEIARLMFQTDGFGLEAPAGDLAKMLPHLPVQETIGVFVHARLGRFGQFGEQRFSFSHRRFNEFFLIRHFNATPEQIPLEAITTDNRWRDALVLFAQVVDDDQIAARMAEHCWNAIQEGEALDTEPEKRLAAIHALRFLAEAFVRRRKVLGTFQRKLSRHIADIVSAGRDLVHMKIAVEATGTLKRENAELILCRALASGNEWIAETAFRSCRYLPSASPRLIGRVYEHLVAPGLIELVLNRAETKLLLSLSDSYSGILALHNRLILAGYVFIGAICLTALPMPIVFASLYVMLAFMAFALSGHSLIGRIDGDICLAGIRINRVILCGAAFYAAMISAALCAGRGEKFGRTALASESVEPIFLVPMLSLPTGNILLTVLTSSAILALVAPPFYVLFSRVSKWRFGCLEPDHPHIRLVAAKISKDIRRRHKNELIAASIVMALCIPVLYWGADILSFINKLTPNAWKEHIMSAFGGLFVVMSLLLHVSHWRRVSRDRAMLTGKIIGTRANILDTFELLKTKEGRDQFLAQLADMERPPQGEWPGGGLSCSKDKAMTALARLDEKWRRLG